VKNTMFHDNPWELEAPADKAACG